MNKKKGSYIPPSCRDTGEGHKWDKDKDGNTYCRKCGEAKLP